MRALVPILLLGACRSFDPDEDVVLVTSARTDGEIEHCGCPVHPLGGLPRRARLLADLRAAAPIVVVDAGNALLPRGSKPGRAAWDQEVVKAEIVAEGLSKGGIDAMAIGESDWHLGLAKIVALRDQWSLPILAANLSCGGKRPFPGSKMVQAGEKKVGIVGVTAGEIEGCVVEPLSEAVPRAVAEVAGADVIVALAPLAAGATADLAAAAPQIAFIVDGASGRRLDVPEDVGDAWWLQPGFRGQGLGLAGLRFEPGATTWALDPPVEGAPPSNHFEWEVALMSEDIPDDPVAADVVARGKERIAAAESPVPIVLGERIAPSGPYAGSDTCKACHAAEHAQWATTAHARAWEGLESYGRSLDRQCIGCHVTGWEAGGPAAPAEAAPYRDVQCEVCHGPGRAHAAAPVAGSIVKTPATALCTTCHDGVQDMGRFDEAAYRPRIVHIESAMEARIPQQQANP